MEETGILHDIDFKAVKNDTLLHGIAGALFLKTTGVVDETGNTVRGDNHLFHTGPIENPVEIALQAVDSASGLIITCALIKGGRLTEVPVKAIAKKV